MLVVLMFVQAVLLIGNVWLHSPNVNEPGHLAAGLYTWHTGRFNVYQVNPPLVRAIAAIPVVLVGHAQQNDPYWAGYTEGTGIRPEHAMGEAWIKANGRRSLLLIRISRLAVLPLVLIGTWVCYRWASDLYGERSGLAAAILWVFEPMVLGHGAMLSADVHGASLGVAACYAFWRWLKSPSWGQAILTGVILGFAEATKTTLILFYPLWPLIWILYRLPERASITMQRLLCEAGMLAMRMIVGLYVLNMVYLGDGTFTQLRDYHFVSELFGGTEREIGRMGGNRFAEYAWSTLPIPLPADYVIGIDLQQRDFEDFGQSSYLLGEFRDHGWWYFYVVALLVKWPIGVLFLFVLTCGSIIRSLPSGSNMGWKIRDDAVLWMPALLIFAVASMKSGMSLHARYVIPCFPFIFIGIGRLWQEREGVSRATFWKTRAATACLVATVASSLLSFPNSVGYFNEAVGGSRNGSMYLMGSCLDWGQDYLLVDRYVKQLRPDQKAYLICENASNPFLYLDERIRSYGELLADAKSGAVDVDDDVVILSSEMIQKAKSYLTAEADVNFYPHDSVHRKTSEIFHEPLQGSTLQQLLQVGPFDWIGGTYVVYSPISFFNFKGEPHSR